ncbi:MAG: hypothetical protein OEV93_00680 [Candidatus Moranbacteria bacterium]|nr:hypothetical protein [Candidatus Moranbacteria bacterium]
MNPDSNPWFFVRVLLGQMNMSFWGLVSRDRHDMSKFLKMMLDLELLAPRGKEYLAIFGVSLDFCEIWLCNAREIPDEDVYSRGQIISSGPNEVVGATYDVNVAQISLEFFRNNECEFKAKLIEHLKNNLGIAGGKLSEAAALL